MIMSYSMTIAALSIVLVCWLVVIQPQYKILGYDW